LARVSRLRGRATDSSRHWLPDALAVPRGSSSKPGALPGDLAPLRR
jgi:hypothetical protein